MAFSSVMWDLDDDPHGNVVHCGEHAVTKEEVEDVLSNPIDTDFSRSTGYPIAFGDTRTGRHLLVVYEEIDTETVYPITAYDVPPRAQP